tara:strand:+ start:46997 stop:47503 length:507 start_codon:yes stop_codon:yes gene_type:complete
MKVMNDNQVYILSDEKGIGKTTALQEWTKKSNNLSGFLSPIVKGKRQFQNIETGFLIPMETDAKDLIVGKYAFDLKSFKTIEELILSYYKSSKSELIILDEIGPLEIYKDQGFHNLLLQLKAEYATNKSKLFFVVRASVLNDFITKYNFKNEVVFNLKEFKAKFINHK